MGEGFGGECIHGARRGNQAQAQGKLYIYIYIYIYIIFEFFVSFSWIRCGGLEDAFTVLDAATKLKRKVGVLDGVLGWCP